MLSILRLGNRSVVQKVARRSDSSQSLGSAPSPLALCDVGMVAPAAPAATEPAEIKQSCLVKVEALESNFAELRSLCMEAKVRSD